MKLLAQIGLFAWISLAAVAADAADGLATVTVDGDTYTHISEVHVSSGGRVTFLYGLGGRTVRADQLPASFLASWGITPADLERSGRKASDSTAAFLANQHAQLLDQALDEGLIREVDGVVCDVRQPLADWERFDGVKVCATTEKGALVDRAPDGPAHDYVLVFNLASSGETGRVTFAARRAGSLNYTASSGPQRILAYDVGRPCKRAEVPEAIVRGVAAQVALPGQASQAKTQGQARLDAAPPLLAKLSAAQAQQEMDSEAAGPWMTSLTQAQALAAQKSRLILLNFTGSDWCVWCKKLDAEIFSTKQFSDYAGKYLVLVCADFPQQKPQPAELRAANQTLKAQFGVSDFPTLVALKADGTVVWKQTGYLPGGPLALISKLDAAMSQ